MAENSAILHSLDKPKSLGSSVDRVQPFFFRPYIQPKLTINQPNDIYEQEADAVADRVMLMTDKDTVQTKFFKPTSVPVQRMCSECEEEEKKKMQRKETNGEPVSADSNLASYVGNLDSGGQSLSSEVRSFYEPRIGYDFGKVKVHTDTVATKSAQSINALAYTSGNNIVFNSGQYSPGTNSGKKLLAHELAHVVQQQHNPASIQRQSIFVSGGVPSFLDCDLKDVQANNTTSCCSAETLKQLPPLYQESKEYADRAIERLNKGANVDSVIIKHFGKDALWQRDTILANIKAIRAELDQSSTHKAICRIALTTDTSGIDLYGKVDRSLFCDFGTLASATRQGKILTLCLDTEGKVLRGWELVLHEVAHFSQVAILPTRTQGASNSATPGQMKSGEYEMYRGEATYPNPAPFSLRNADSYAWFVSEVGDKDWVEDSNAAAYAPTVEGGGVVTLDKNPRFGVGGRILWSPLGKNIQLTTGFEGLYIPGQDRTDATATDRPTLRGYAGAELGVRWIIGGDSVQAVIDVAGSGGAYFNIDGKVDPGAAVRAGIGVRFGGPQVGFGISAEAMKVFNLSQGDLSNQGTKDWIGGLVISGHWGGSSSRPR